MLVKPLTRRRRRLGLYWDDRFGRNERLAMNAICSLMVHLDGTPRSEARLELAYDIARAQDAQLTALFAAVPPMLPTPYAYGASGAVAEMLIRLHDTWRTSARALFDKVTQGRCERCTWVEPPDALVANGVAREALLADLLVLGQREHDEPQAGQLPPGFVPSVLVASGRPALVVPYTGEFKRVGENVLIAWKPTPESARALIGALPLMRQARHVRVAVWGDDPQANGAQGPDVIAHLKRHGIDATLHWQGQETDALGEMLLSRAADFGADLLVMGCYSHSRAREFVLGGVTRTVLESMTLPVLMSH